jgi:hypothetical protein
LRSSPNISRQFKGAITGIIISCITVLQGYAQDLGYKSFKLIDDNETFKINTLLKQQTVIFTQAPLMGCIVLMALALKK